jgi:hypothetical protein
VTKFIATFACYGFGGCGGIFSPTLFVVWQRQQEEENAFGSFDVARDTRALFRAPAQNVLLLKMSFWTGF